MLNIKVFTDDTMNNCLIRSINRSLTGKQIISLNKRLSMDHVKPLSLFKHDKYNTIVLSCINTNLSNPKPFYFLYWDNGQEHGRGYDFMEGNDSYTMLINLDKDITITA